MTEKLYNKTIECPVCQNSFNTKKVRTSSIRMLKRDSDFCPYYTSENPLFYSVYVCNNCGYGALEGSFNSIVDSGKQSIRDFVTPKWHKRDFGGKRSVKDAIDAYKIALLCHQITKSPKSIIGNICLRLAWFYRYLEDSREMEFINHAIKSFESAYIGERIDKDQHFDEIVVLYIIGELNRRAGNYKEAISWFNKTLEHKNIKKKRHIELKAREQWALTREQYKMAK